MSTDFTSMNQVYAKILERQNLLPSDILDKLLTRARTLQEWLGQVAVDDGFLSYQELAGAVSRDMKIPLVELKTWIADLTSLQRLPAETCRSFSVIPLDYHNGTLYLAMANPLDEEAKTTLHGLIRCDLAVQIAPRDEIMEAISNWYARLHSMQADAHYTGEEDDEAKEGAREHKSYREALYEQRGISRSVDTLTLDELLVSMMDGGASDLHLAVGSPPIMRVDGELRPMPFPILTTISVQTMIYSILTDVQITTFERHWELDFGYSIPGLSRFRLNVHRQRGAIGAVLRTIPVEVPTLKGLAMPPIVRDLTTRPRGLVLVTGPTGSGKSTTLAAMVEEINRNRPAHIVTIEDPIEFVHHNVMSVITQREVGSDTESFAVALRHVLRQDPDVIMIGEMRDLETIAAALTAAETGHLVFATLHTTSSAQTVDRIIDVFPPHQQEQIRSQLANVLEGIITQTLLMNIDGRGRSCAQEILLATSAIRNLIRENKVHQMASVIQASAKYGMQTLDMALKQLVLRGKVSLDEAMRKASNPEDFKALVAVE